MGPLCSQAFDPLRSKSLSCIRRCFSWGCFVVWGAGLGLGVMGGLPVFPPPFAASEPHYLTWIQGQILDFNFLVVSESLSRVNVR